MTTNSQQPDSDSSFTTGMMLGGVMGAALVWLFATKSGQEQKEKLRSGGVTIFDELEKYLKTHKLPPQAEKEWHELTRSYQKFKAISPEPTKALPAKAKPAKKTTPKKKNSTIKRKFIIKKK